MTPLRLIEASGPVRVTPVTTPVVELTVAIAVAGSMGVPPPVIETTGALV